MKRFAVFLTTAVLAAGSFAPVVHATSTDAGSASTESAAADDAADTTTSEDAAANATEAAETAGTGLELIEDSSGNSTLTPVGETGDGDSGEAAAGSSAEETTGQAGDTVYAVEDMDGDRTVAVTFVMDVPSDVSTPCVVSFVESESYIEYYVEAYRSANYTVTQYMAPGTYIITDGGPIDDNTSSYSVLDKSYFTVSEDGDGDSVVRVTIRSKGDTLRGDTGSTEDDEETSEVTAAEETTEEKDYRWLYVLAAVLCMLFGGTVTYLGLKYFKSQEI